MIKILTIGNRLSEDATAYLCDIAKFDNSEIEIMNLSIPDGSLETHWRSVIGGNADYAYRRNGAEQAGKKVSIHDALTGDEWDFVTIQQAAALGGVDTSFYPYIKNLAAYVKKFAPGAKQYVCQTWAYEAGCKLGDFKKYNNDQREMYRSIVWAHQNAARNIKAKIIPCGDIIQKLRGAGCFDPENGGLPLCGDGCNMDACYGKYALSAVWYELLAAGNILENKFIPPPQDAADKRLIGIIRQTVHETIKR